MARAMDASESTYKVAQLAPWMLLKHIQSRTPRAMDASKAHTKSHSSRHGHLKAFKNLTACAMDAQYNSESLSSHPAKMTLIASMAWQALIHPWWWTCLWDTHGFTSARRVNLRNAFLHLQYSLKKYRYFERPYPVIKWSVSNRLHSLFRSLTIKSWIGHLFYIAFVSFPMESIQHTGCGVALLFPFGFELAWAIMTIFADAHVRLS